MGNNMLLLNCINQVNGYDPMPNNGTKLPPCDILQIQAWINDGMPNN